MKERTFEESIEMLENIVSKLESQDTSLEEAMKLFQTGVELSSECSKKLENAKQAVHALIEQDGQMKKEEFISDDK